MPDPIEILQKYAKPVPRYTSYPTAPHFQQGLGEAILPEMIASAANGGGTKIIDALQAVASFASRTVSKMRPKVVEVR